MLSDKPCKYGHVGGRYSCGKCIECGAAQGRAYRAMNAPKIRAQRDEWVANNRDRHNATSRKAMMKVNMKDHRRQILLNAKQRAKKRGLPFSLTLNDIVIPNFCPILGIPLVVNRAGSIRDTSPSLDRIVPELGYVPGNVAVISGKANAIKNNGTPEDVMAVATWLRAQYPQWLLAS